MLIITIRTDSADTEITLLQNHAQVAAHSWQAGRALSVTLHAVIEKLLHDIQKDWSDLEGIVVYKGPGSFTGLRIGITVGNTLAYAFNIPIVSTMGDGWIKSGQVRLEKGDNELIALPEYGAEANISKPRK